MGWGFAESIIFAAIMTMRDMSKEAEKSKKWIKTQSFYQECYEKIADDSHNAFNTGMRVAKKSITLLYSYRIRNRKHIFTIVLLCTGIKTTTTN